MSNECRCGRPTRDAAYVCDDCSESLARALGEIPWLDEELEITVSRQKGMDYRRVGGGKGGKKPAERPLPADMGASEARTHLKGVLVSWVRYSVEERVRNSSPHQGIPADTLPAISRWLLWRVDGLALLDIGPEAVEEVTSAVAHCHRLIDRPADRQYLGACDQCDDGRIYARPGSRWARCEACDVAEDADARRSKLLDELDDRLCTASEIARLSTYMALKADRETVRKRVNQWHARGTIAKEAAFTDEPAFRFGIVRRLLEHADSEKAG